MRRATHCASPFFERTRRPRCEIRGANAPTMCRALFAVKDRAPPEKNLEIFACSYLSGKMAYERETNTILFGLFHFASHTL